MQETGPACIEGDERCAEEGAVGLDVTDRNYFQTIQTQPGKEFHFGRPIASRVHGNWVIPLSVAARDESGSLLAVVAAFLDKDYFHQWVASPVVTSEDELILLHRDGSILQAPPAFQYSFGL